MTKYENMIYSIISINASVNYLMQEEILKALYDWNPWLEKSFPKELSGHPRSYFLDPYLQIPEVKILEGARRVGKSTLFYQIIEKLLLSDKNTLYVNFEDEILKKYTLSEIISVYQTVSSLNNLFVD